MKVITVNLNGIRSAARKDFFTWLGKEQADIICLQETKAQMATLSDPTLRPAGYHCYFSDAIKRGYSGVGLYTRREPDRVVHTLGWPVADQEGRYLQADFGSLTVCSLYLPSGTSGDERQALKYEFMEQYTPKLEAIAQESRDVIICGDWNIAHKAIDLKNWRSNQTHSGFLPEERAWMSKIFDEIGLVDAFRVLNQSADQYTWWSFRGQARAKNVGWRIDYQVITSSLRDKVKRVAIYKDQYFSDHAPLIVEYDYKTYTTD